MWMMNNELSSSSDEDDLKVFLLRRLKPKNENYIQETVAEYNDREFLDHFRVSKQVAQDICDRFSQSEYVHHQAGEYGKISPYECTIVFLWFVGHEAASYRDVADRFDISLSSLRKIIERMIYFLSNLSPQLIKWPNLLEQTNIEEHFRNNNFPGVIGIIDGTHIKIDRPSQDPDSYLNRKHYFSVQAQVVCDHKRKILDIFVGFPGSVHDSRVFRASPLFATLAEKCQNFYTLGDSGYSYLQHLLTPFRDRGNLDPQQQNYNYKLATNRYVIEHCFGILKQKFRQLYHLKLRKMEDIVNFIRACCVLHNFALVDEVNLDEDHENIENLVINMDRHEDMNVANIDERGGIQMRNYVVGILPLH